MAHGLGGSTMDVSPRGVLLGNNRYPVEMFEAIEGDEMPGEIDVLIAPRVSLSSAPQVPLINAPLTSAGVELVVRAVLEAEAATAAHGAEATGDAA